ncbi:oxidoreductase [Xanthomonas citri pv. durantae]|uniref:Oxidoreductase n=1 Tax=Xanthomonas citri pv. durantae TaxID=487862 RepID=A0A9X6BFR6_XANCI|nr:PDR/VanB family oxidoreductase [Xanthomonas citri]QRD56570.1 oxidoreductase [Xanthomonas citri pv. citri]UVG56997.1 oxidoreductase [Xanthomonas citri pv. durantae]CEH50175.1 Vanillate demethylase subunit B [Xanthomonas citri pv. citri]CEH94222.1 Vanillate demethylase subunit B [Xanthomonas citri pv. citri]
MDFLEASVVGVQPLCDDVKRIEIAYRQALLPFDPGSHIDLKVYIEDRVETRSYSVVEHSAPDRLVIAVRLLPQSRGGSEYMHGLHVGQRLEITAPSNHFTLGLNAPEVLLLAGGIGVTPIIGMARRLREQQIPFKFVYLGRTRMAMPFLDALLAEFEDRLEVWADDERGVVDLPALLTPLHVTGELYMCGPVPMMEAVRKVWNEHGRPAERLRFETFGGAGLKPAQAFRVVVPARGLDFMVPTNRSLLDALDEAGAEPLYSCKRGECGLCAVDVIELDGELDHRDVFFSERQKQESRQLCACVSRAIGSITIELP